MALGQVAVLLLVIFAVLIAPVIVVYFATGGSAIALLQLGHVYVVLGIATGVVGIVAGMVVSLVRRRRTGPRP
jgi:hypothetical protein